MSDILSNAQIISSLDAQMQRAIEQIMQIMMRKEDEFLEASARADIQESDSAISGQRTFLHELAHYEDPLLHRQINFWMCMFNAAMANAIKFPADSHCDHEAWFNEIVIPLITKEFGSSGRVEQAQLLSRLGVECLVKIKYLLPLNLVAYALTYDRSGLRAKVAEGVLARELSPANH